MGNKFCPLRGSHLDDSCDPEHCAPACELAGEGNTPICPIVAATSSLAMITALTEMSMADTSVEQCASLNPEAKKPNPLQATLAKLGVPQQE